MTEDRQAISEQLALAIQHHQAGRLEDAENLCRKVCAREPRNVRALHLLGIVGYRLGRDDCMDVLTQALSIEPGNPDLHNDLGVIFGSLGRYREAEACLERTVALRPKYVEAWDNLGSAASNLSKYPEAIRHFERALSMRPNFALARVHLGNAFAMQGRFEDAVTEYDRALAADPKFIMAHYSLAAALKRLGRLTEAAAHLNQILAIAPNFAEAHDSLGTILQGLGELNEAVAHCQRAVALRPRFAGAHNNLANILLELGRLDDALSHYEQAISLDPQFTSAYYNFGAALRRKGKFADAAQCFARALELRPDFVEARLALCIAQLPIVYSNPNEILERRAAYRSCLEELQRRTTQGSNQGLADAVGVHQPFYLAYQGLNDRDLQALYGSLVCEAIATRYPTPTHYSSRRESETVKVGIVSGFFRQHSNWKIPIKGWLSQLDRSRFRIFGYYTGQEVDSCTLASAALCERFVQGPLSSDQYRRSILEDEPHVLIYPEIGMDPTVAHLAAQRLAPVQCASWGHPETTGYPTIDFYLSSELMEPDDGAQHYVERLVRLPNLSIYYEPETVEASTTDRSKFGLRPEGIVFWCGQSLYKYLPQYDDVFAHIAVGSRNCQFAFVKFPGTEHVTDILKGRLDRTFEAFGLRSSDYCVFLPRLDAASFFAAMGTSDIFLDSIGWSGCNSTLESLRHALPIVTLPGNLMRSRHTAAILRMIGITETITTTTKEYVSAAINLATNDVLRAGMRTKISQNRYRAYRDKTCISALETFLYQQASVVKAVK
jgi:protein O-GlcNAc transferase